MIEGVLSEDTQRQDNAYGSLVAKLRVDARVAARLALGDLKVNLAFATKPHTAAAKKGAKRQAAEARQQVRSSPSLPQRFFLLRGGSGRCDAVCL